MLAYEWITNATDPETGDIEDVNGWETFAEAMQHMRDCTPEEMHIELTREIWEADGDQHWLRDRAWAMLDGETLTPMFRKPNADGDYVSTGHPVPQRFLKEVQRYFAAQRRAAVA